MASTRGLLSRVTSTVVALRRRLAARVPWALLRSLALGACLLASAYFLIGIFGKDYPVRQWLFWRYALSWLGTGIFCLAVLSTGRAVVSALLRGEHVDGHFVLSFSTGVFAFSLLVFLVGLFGGLHPVAFFLIPLALLVAGAPRWYRDLKNLRRPRFDLGFSGWEIVAFGAGVVALIFVYVPMLAPENVAYDARWYHLGVAEHYVAQGAIRRFPEGPVFATIPQLASMLYTWAFLLPGSELFDRIALSAHIEFAIFLVTLAGIPPLVRHLVPGARARLSWVALFLFPAIFLYDATLSVAADHVAALFAIPAYLAMVSALRTLDPRIVSILVVQLCGLVMTKYTAAGVAVLPILAVLVRAAILFVRSVRARRLVGNWLFGPFVALLLGLVLTAPLWLKNYVWYGDPFYPVLHEYFSPRPWTPDAPHLYRVYKSEAWGAVGTGAEKLEGTLRALYDYSLAVYNWSYFHKSFPIVGSLFTFGLVALPFLGKVWRIWALVLATHVGIAVWYLLWHHDRYLQPLIPWMAACISAMAIVAWRLGVAARIGVVALAAVQLVWGLDMPFWPNHQMTGRSGIGYAADFFGRAFSLDFTSRTRPFEDMARIGREVPKRSKVLLHHEHVRLGLGVMSAWDWPRFQFGLSYGRLGSSRALHRKLKEFGVTHIAWIPKHVYADDTLASELVFHTYVGQYLKQVRSVSGRSLGALPRTTPPQERAEVFVYGCDTYLPSGLYRLEDLHVSPLIVPGQPFPNFPPPRVPFANDVEALLSRTDRAVVNMACPSPPTLPGFELVANHGMKALYARVRAAGP